MRHQRFGYSILHISDLHRSAEGPISNDELISSLRVDKHRYVAEDPPVRSPDAIVVSGDLVQGVSLGYPDHMEELRSQYSVAEDFLARLCEEFVRGDRAKVILVPGNHDIDWNTSRAAMAEIGADREPPPELALREDSQYRWDWSSKRFYQIIDPHRYSQRLDAFWEFAERFYTGVPGIIRFNRGSDYNVFRLCEGRIGVVAFNSCEGTDCFAHHGSIKREAIARSHLELDSTEYSFQLLIAVWHHNVEGPPYRTDYMDIDIVRNMIGRGFRLGLYGHHHRSQAEPHHIFLPDRNTMAIASSGSLCAGPRDLPTGVYRQYNMVELSDDLQSARFHVRQMETAQLFSRAHLTAVGGRSYIDLHWDKPKGLDARLVANAGRRHPQAILRAEHGVKDSRFPEALALLEPILADLQPYGRIVFFEAAVGARRWDLVIKAASPPRSILELTSLVEAYDQTQQYALGKEALAKYGVELEMPARIRSDLMKRLAIRAMQTN